jgi:hypothetical protein
LPLLAMQVWKLEDQTRKAMKSMNVRHLKLSPLMFTIMWLGERERERESCVYFRTGELLRLSGNNWW